MEICLRSKLLLERKANPNISLFSGDFALRFAALNGRVDICGRLLSAGANNTAVYKGRTAADCASADVKIFIASWSRG